MIFQGSHCSVIFFFIGALPFFVIGSMHVQPQTIPAFVSIAYSNVSVEKTFSIEQQLTEMTRMIFQSLLIDRSRKVDKAEFDTKGRLLYASCMEIDSSVKYRFSCTPLAHLLLDSIMYLKEDAEHDFYREETSDANDGKFGSILPREMMAWRSDRWKVPESTVLIKVIDDLKEMTFRFWGSVALLAAWGTWPAYEMAVKRERFIKKCIQSCAAVYARIPKERLWVAGFSLEAEELLHLARSSAATTALDRKRKLSVHRRLNPFSSKKLIHAKTVVFGSAQWPLEMIGLDPSDCMRMVRLIHKPILHESDLSSVQGDDLCSQTILLKTFMALGINSLTEFRTMWPWMRDQLQSVDRIKLTLDRVYMRTFGILLSKTDPKPDQQLVEYFKDQSGHSLMAQWNPGLSGLIRFAPRRISVVTTQSFILDSFHLLDTVDTFLADRFTCLFQKEHKVPVHMMQVVEQEVSEDLSMMGRLFLGHTLRVVERTIHFQNAVIVDQSLISLIKYEEGRGECIHIHCIY